MNNKITNFLAEKFDCLQHMGLIDTKTPKDKYLDVAQRVMEEQEEKNQISDKSIDYNDEIVSIEFVGDRETVDITVTGDSLFFCNGILTKNSIGLAATADLIASLWQSDEDREIGVISIGMQKNRFGPNYGIGAFKCNYNTLTLSETDPDVFVEDGDPTENVVNGADNTLNKLINED